MHALTLTPRWNLSRQFLIALILFGFGFVQPASAALYSFQQGAAVPGLGIADYQGTEDNMIIQWAPTYNFGGRGDFDIGMQSTTSRAHSLLRFDLSAFAGKTIEVNSATLILTAIGRPSYSPAQGGVIQVFPLADANVGWQEGNFASAIAGNPAVGDSTYNHRNATSTNWAGSNGASTAGTDYLNTLLASQAYTMTDVTAGNVFNLSLSGDLSFIETWAAGGTNAGFFLRDGIEPSAINRINFASSEFGTLGMRPMLLLDVTIVPEPSTLVLLGLGGLMAFASARRARRRRVC